MNSRNRHLPMIGAPAACLLLICITHAPAGPPRPVFTAAGKAFPFDTGKLRGTLRKAGRSRGIQPAFTAAPPMPLAGGAGLLSPYRLLTPDARFGTAAWDWASRASLLGDGAVEVHWQADKEHPLDMRAVYRWASADTLDFHATVTPKRKLKRFELFLASYFSGFPASFAYARRKGEAGGEPAFLEATKADGHWQAFPRDEEAARMVADGRWKHPPNPVVWKIRPRLAGALAIRRDARRGLAAVLMAPASDCFAILMPYGEEGHRSVYFSLIGRDLKAGESATAQARLVIRREITDEQAVAMYRAYTRKLPRVRARSAGFDFFALCMDTHDAKRRTLAQQAQLLKQLGYDGAGHLWLAGLRERIDTLDAAGLKLFQVYFRLNISAGAKRPYDPQLKRALLLLKGRPTTVAVLVSGGKPSDTAADARAVALLREMADLARPHGVRLVLYPHAGDWLEKFGDAVRVATKVDRPNVGVMFNLCHFLKVDHEKNIAPQLEQAGPLLMAVSINGSDRSADIRGGKGKWIAPLDEGNFDMAGLLRTLRRIGYTGPVGLQCYGLRGDARDHLSRSVAVWRRLNAAADEK